MKLRPPLLLLLTSVTFFSAVPATLSQAPAGKEKPSKEKTAAATATAEEDDDDGPATPGVLPGGKDGTATRGGDFLMRGRLDQMLPVGRSHKGVRFPEFRPVVPDPDAEPADPQTAAAGVSAALNSLFESDLVTRLDDNHVQFDKAKWVQYDDSGDSATPSMALTLERGVYDLSSDVLMSNRGVIIETPRMRFDAATMLHDRATGLTRLTGSGGQPVKVTFFLTPEEQAAAAPPAAASAEAEASDTSPNPSPTPTPPAERPAKPAK